MTVPSSGSAESRDKAALPGARNLETFFGTS